MDVSPARLLAQRKEERLPILHSLQPGIKQPSYLVAFIAPFHVIQINSKILSSLRGSYTLLWQKELWV
jgi:hypothetical protein